MKNLKQNTRTIKISQDKTCLKMGKNQEKTLEFPLTKNGQTENAMFCLSQKKEELERYQDCSWFQNKPVKEDFTNKLSQAEVSFSPDIGLDEINLAMQFANKSIPPWGDDCLEVFDEVDMNLELDQKINGKNEVTYPPIEYSFENYEHKNEEEIVPEIAVYDNYTIKKTDSFENMKTLSSTCLSDIIPITYQEQLNANSNMHYDNVCKYKGLEEHQSCINEQHKYIIESDEDNLNIGREEVIDVSTEDHSYDEVEVMKVKAESKFNVSHEKKEDHATASRNRKQVIKFENRDSSVIHQQQSNVSQIEKSDSHTQSKAALKLELSKTAIEQMLVNESSPDFEFMGLVNYITSEKFSDLMDLSPTNNMEVYQKSNMPLKESSSNMCPRSLSKIGQFCSKTENSSMSNFPVLQSKINTDAPLASEGKTTPNDEDMSNSLSIAERVKVGFTRKRSKRFNMEALYAFNAEDDDLELEANKSEDSNCTRIPGKRSRSRSINSISSKSTVDERFEVDTYRERRDKNNAASRKSRQNKKNKERLMNKAREEAECKNQMLKKRADKLEKLVIFLRQMLLQFVKQM